MDGSSDRAPPDDLTWLSVSRPLAAPTDRVRRMLSARDAPWLGARVADAELNAGWRRFLVDMRLPIGDGRWLTFTKSAYVDLGPSDAGTVEIAWRPASLQPLFPVFAGQLTITPHALQVEGRYAPPGGRLGRIVGSCSTSRPAALPAGCWTPSLPRPSHAAETTDYISAPSPPSRCVATNAAACPRRCRSSFARMLLT